MVAIVDRRLRLLLVRQLLPDVRLVVLDPHLHLFDGVERAPMEIQGLIAVEGPVLLRDPLLGEAKLLRCCSVAYFNQTFENSIFLGIYLYFNTYIQNIIYVEIIIYIVYTIQYLNSFQFIKFIQSKPMNAKTIII